MENEAINLKASPEHHLLFFGIFMKPKVINFMTFAMIFVSVLLLDILLQKQCPLNPQYNRNLCRNVVRNIRGADLYFAFLDGNNISAPEDGSLIPTGINISHIFLLYFSVRKTLSLVINTRTGCSASWLWSLSRHCKTRTCRGRVHFTLLLILKY